MSDPKSPKEEKKEAIIERYPLNIKSNWEMDSDLATTILIKAKKTSEEESHMSDELINQKDISKDNSEHGKIETDFETYRENITKVLERNYKNENETYKKSTDNSTKLNPEAQEPIQEKDPDELKRLSPDLHPNKSSNKKQPL